jgi:hypothetical protein
LECHFAGNSLCRGAPIIDTALRKEKLWEYENTVTLLAMPWEMC